MSEDKKDLINALNCAVNTLRGQGGGFSPHEKANAADRLWQEMQNQITACGNEEVQSDPPDQPPH